MTDWKDEARRRESRYGAYDYRTMDAKREADRAARQAEKDRDARAYKALTGGNSSAKKTDKVICTELYLQGLMTEDDYTRCFVDARERLTKMHMLGYHCWALGAVRHMRRSQKATLVWRHLAQARANQIAYRRGARSNPSRLGSFLIAIGEPLCLVLGKLIALYGRRETTRSGSSAQPLRVR